MIELNEKDIEKMWQETLGEKPMGDDALTQSMMRVAKQAFFSGFRCGYFSGRRDEVSSQINKLKEDVYG